MQVRPVGSIQNAALLARLPPQASTGELGDYLPSRRVLLRRPSGRRDYPYTVPGHEKVAQTGISVDQSPPHCISAD